MGGVGSGSGIRAGAKRVVESCQSIDIRRWRREGLLTAGREFGYYWSSSGSFSTIRVRYARDHVILSYRNAGARTEGPAKEHFIALVTMPGVFGGVRHYFCCPGSGCGRRADILHFDGEIFVCRRCANVAYTSQCESVGDRARRRARKARAKLGGSANLIESLPGKKPKWMRWRTYERLMAQAGEADACSWASLAGELARLRR